MRLVFFFWEWEDGSFQQNETGEFFAEREGEGCGKRKTQYSVRALEQKMGTIETFPGAIGRHISLSPHQQIYLLLHQIRIYTYNLPHQIDPWAKYLVAFFKTAAKFESFESNAKQYHSFSLSLQGGMISVNTLCWPILSQGMISVDTIYSISWSLGSVLRNIIPWVNIAPRTGMCQKISSE